MDLHLRYKDLFEQYLICKLFIYSFTYLFICLYVFTACICLFVKFKLLSLNYLVVFRCTCVVELRLLVTLGV